MELGGQPPGLLRGVIQIRAVLVLFVGGVPTKEPGLGAAISALVALQDKSITGAYVKDALKRIRGF